MCKCLFCGSQVEKDYKDWFSYYDCHVCGKYILPESTIMSIDNHSFELVNNKAVRYLLYHTYDERYNFIGDLSAYEKYMSKDDRKRAVLVTFNDIENWQPKTFADKIDCFLLYLSFRCRYESEHIKIPKEIIRPLLFINQTATADEAYSQINYFDRFLYETGLIEKPIDDGPLTGERPRRYTLKPKAWDRIYELQKTQSNNKNVFVAMSFHKTANKIREAIKTAITNAKYSTVLMDEIIHNHQIVPEMLRLIRESRFMIMDITEPNFGAYYEAGYAQGLGKEVIITCKESVWNEKNYLCELDKDCYYKQIATKPHFDVAQKQILVWKDYSDLIKKLTEWIKSIIG